MKHGSQVSDKSSTQSEHPIGYCKTMVDFEHIEQLELDNIVNPDLREYKIKIYSKINISLDKY